jgi:hypothetical protein
MVTGIITVDEYAKKHAELLVIFKAAEASAHKSGAAVVNQKQEFFKQMAAFETKGIADSSARQIKAINAELAKHVEQAKKVIKNRQDREAAIINLTISAENQIKAINKKAHDDEMALMKTERDAHKKTSDDRIALWKAQDSARHKLDLALLSGQRKTSATSILIAKLEDKIKLDSFKASLTEAGIVGEAAEIRITEFTRQQAAARIEIAKIEAASKRDAMMAGIGQVAGMMAGAFSKNKEMAVVSTTIDTFQSAMAAYKSLAGIPYIGPVLGALAAAAAVKMGMDNVSKIKSQEADASGLGGVKGSAGGGLDRVPRDMTMLVHENEMIVPEDPAKIIRQYANSMKKNGGGGAQTVNMMGNWFDGEQSLRDMGRRQARIQHRTTAARRH